MNFVAIDFETANSRLSSACQVGIVSFVGGEPLECFDSLIDPEDDFSFMNVGIHGIEADTIIGAPSFRDLYPEISKRIANQVVVSHGAFDRGVLAQCCARYGLPEIPCKWLDSIRVARRVWLERTSSGYGLRDIACALDIPLRHHNALDDARVAGLIVVHALRHSQSTVDEWLHRSLAPIGGSQAIHAREGDPAGPLYGETVVFTGQLSVPRRLAAEMAAKMGCDVAQTVSKKVSLLVVGDQDLSRLSGQVKSAKHVKAEQLVEQGHSLRILTESDWVAFVALHA